MDQTHHNLLAIGAFARAAGLSLKALRLYAQLGLLVPRYTDPSSGYRYYAPDQLPQARLICLMREIEMPLATIRQVLESGPDRGEALARAYLAELEARVAYARRLVPHLIANLRKEAQTMGSISVRTVEPQPVLSITQRVKIDRLEATIQESLAALRAAAAAEGIAAVGAPFGIYHGTINVEDDGPIEVCLPVERLVETKGPVAASTLPAGRVAVAELRGEQCVFPAVLQGYDATSDWIERNGYVMDGPPREYWLEPPSDNNPDNRMEIVWPFTERAD
ncbi:MAG TPA: MerR family transcriptional regulator [Roseiflexaceae bacterium]|nr:MerR family transcriptional regulator [Roseiflexaceae bacterium]